MNGLEASYISESWQRILGLSNKLDEKLKPIISKFARSKDRPGLNTTILSNLASSNNRIKDYKRNVLKKMSESPKNRDYYLIKTLEWLNKLMVNFLSPSLKSVVEADDELRAVFQDMAEVFSSESIKEASQKSSDIGTPEKNDIKEEIMELDKATTIDAVKGNELALISEKSQSKNRANAISILTWMRGILHRIAPIFETDG